MRPASHQTARLSRGKHAGPDQGVCVMELASMLAGEPFSDHPPAVSPVLGAYLRSYNDVAGDEARQDLRRLAADAVGTAGPEWLEAARTERCVQELAALQARRSRLRRMLGPRPARAHPVSPPELERLTVQLSKLLWRQGPDGHARAVTLADELVAMRDDGGSDRVAPRPMVAV